MRYLGSEGIQRGGLLPHGVGEELTELHNGIKCAVVYTPAASDAVSNVACGSGLRH